MLIIVKTSYRRKLIILTLVMFIIAGAFSLKIFSNPNKISVSWGEQPVNFNRERNLELANDIIKRETDWDNEISDKLIVNTTDIEYANITSRNGIIIVNYRTASGDKGMLITSKRKIVEKLKFKKEPILMR